MLMSDLAYYIDCDLDTFVEECSEMTFMDLVNLKKAFEIQYSSITYLKDMLIKGLEEGKFSDVDEAKKNLNNMYDVLFILEERAKIIEAYRQSMGSIEN